jgi:hypothetical protein
MLKCGSIGLILPLVVAFSLLYAQTEALAQQTGTLHGVVKDPSGAAVSGTSITAAGPGSTIYSAVSNEQGEYRITGVVPGQYTLHASKQGFAPFESQHLEVTAGISVELDPQLSLLSVENQVTVSSQADSLSVEQSANANAIVLKGEDLDALPDDPDDLLTDLKAIAGPGAGAMTSQLFLDGFSGGRLPPKDSIREVRINQDPFSAEYDALGYGRIEVFTKPGSNAVHGSMSYRASDASMNSRNPLSTIKPPYRSQQEDGNIGGALGKKMSWFMDFERRDVQDNAIVSATALTPALQPYAVSQAVMAPFSSTMLDPRLDIQLNNTNTLTVRYSWLGTNVANDGIGQFALPTAGYDLYTGHHTMQITETAVLGPNTILDTGFQFNRDQMNYQTGYGQTSLRVLDSFTGGGSSIGPSSNVSGAYELHNYASLERGKHQIKLGVRVRESQVQDSSYRNFGGTYIFSGGTAPELNALNQPVLGPGGVPIDTTITSLESYRRTLLFQNAGYTASQIRTLGGGPSQFMLNSGVPYAALSEADAGLFIQDDWKLRPNLTLAGGLRYEIQSNVPDFRDIAPRLGLAWSPGQHGKTVIRAGGGIFYDRIAPAIALDAMRFGGTLQQQYVVQHPTFFPATPSAASLAGFGALGIQKQLDPNLRAPALMQVALSVERELSRNTILSATFIESHGDHLLRSRDINAPLPGTYPAGQPQKGLRPYSPNDIYQYESAGIFNQRQLLINVSRRLSNGLSIFGYYAWSHAMSNTDGPNWFVSNPYNANADYGRSAYNMAHSLVIGSTYLGPCGIQFSPFLIARSGAPFDITTGTSPYGDLLFNARPSFASAAASGVVATPYGLFQTNPALGATLIPRNYGTGPMFLTLNMRISRTFGFGSTEGGTHAKKVKNAAAESQMIVTEPTGSAAEGRVHDASTAYRFNLVVALIARNALNGFNPGLPVGDLSSPLFGQSNWLASAAGPMAAMYGDDRRIFLQIKFRF